LNSAVNPITALARCTNGTLMQEPALFEIARNAAHEAARVGKKLGVLDPDFDPEEALRAILRETAGNLSSMREDMAAGAAPRSRRSRAWSSVLPRPSANPCLSRQRSSRWCAPPSAACKRSGATPEGGPAIPA